MDLGMRSPRPLTTNSLSRRTKKHTNRIEIPLRAGYKPRSGPPVLPVSLLPPHDSTAYILERILLPAKTTRDGKLSPKRMTYLIGWSDLPAATMLVPAMQVLDYVSPWVLENWEYEAELELEEMRQKLEAEKKVEDVQSLVAGVKRKRGRPHKKGQIESAVVADSEDDLADSKRIGVNAMSLSTPRKSRMLDFEGLSEEEDGTPTRQLVGEAVETLAKVDQAELIKQEDGTGVRNVLLISKSNTTTPWTHHPSESTVENESIPKAVPRQTPVVPLPSDVSQSGAKSSSSLIISAPLEPLKSTGPTKLLKTNSDPPIENTEWVIERIEDMEVYELEGVGLVRFFKVRWEGDWPSDQNPTWEPEENIPPEAIRNFIKTPRHRRKGDGKKTPTPGEKTRTPRKKLKQALLPWTKSYSSVSAAFEGQLEGLAEGLAENEGYFGQERIDNGRKAYEDADELLVVDHTRKSSKGIARQTAFGTVFPAFR